MWKLFWKLVREFRFLASKIIFEIIFKKEPAQQVAEKIDKEVDEYNEKYSHGARCYSCGNKKMNSAQSGHWGFFASPNYFYRCPECGNEQSDNGFYMKYEIEQIGKLRITKDSTSYSEKYYRYMILSTQQWFILIAIAVCWFLWSGFEMGSL